MFDFGIREISLMNDPPQPTADEEPSQEEKIRKQLTQTAGGGKVVCRLCKGSHFTAKCPYKDSLPILNEGGAGTSNIADLKRSSPLMYL